MGSSPSDPGRRSSSSNGTWPWWPTAWSASTGCAPSSASDPPSRGPAEPGPDGRTEHEVTMRLAAALADELGRRGSRPLIVRVGNEDPPDPLRAERANRAGAAACVSIRLGGPERSSGAACVFYGTPTTHSPAGRRLAELILSELVDLGLRDAGTYPMALPILRETQMPAVQVEPFGWDDPDRSRLDDPGFPTAFAGAVVWGLEGLFR